MTIISPDNYLLTPEGTYVWSPTRVSEAWEQAYKDLGEALDRATFKHVVMMVGLPGAGKTTALQRRLGDGSQSEWSECVFFDATLTKAKDRKRLRQFAEQHGAGVAVVFVDTPLDICLARNAARSEDRRVPEHVIRNMHRHLEDNPPSEREGMTVCILR